MIVNFSLKRLIGMLGDDVLVALALLLEFWWWCVLHNKIFNVWYSDSISCKWIKVRIGVVIRMLKVKLLLFSFSANCHCCWHTLPGLLLLFRFLPRTLNILAQQRFHSRLSLPQTLLLLWEFSLKIQKFIWAFVSFAFCWGWCGNLKRMSTFCRSRWSCIWLVVEG